MRNATKIFIIRVFVLVLINLLLFGCNYDKPIKPKKKDENTFYFDPIRSRNKGIPLWIAILIADDYSHVMNAVLIGDSVLKYEDWLIFEPQTDYIFNYGRPNIPNSSMSFAFPQWYMPGLDSAYFELGYYEFVRFEFNNKGIPKATYFYPNMPLTRNDAFKR